MKNVIVHCDSGKAENMAINAGGCVSLVMGGYRNSCFILWSKNNNNNNNNNNNKTQQLKTEGGQKDYVQTDKKLQNIELRA